MWEVRNNETGMYFATDKYSEFSGQILKFTTAGVPYSTGFKGSITKAVTSILEEFPDYNTAMIQSRLEMANIKATPSHIRTIKSQMGITNTSLRKRGPRVENERLLARKPVRTAVRAAVENVTVDDLKAVAEIAAKLGGLDKVSAAIDAFEMLQNLGKKS